ncbi:c-type cytochrome [Comamonas jiangduensis]|jgi:cytochrome c553|uniref:c-type cytochrome n=1 Tax=Comamonas jiangduensis TaxID=1194168 RepID=UPI0028A6AEFE|nr:c-type cytochrome [Comamonas jiangduensis]
MIKTWTTVFAMFVACATSSATAQTAQGDIQAGKGKVAMCIGCHGIPGYQASFPEVHKVPMIGGQSAAYMAAALDAYRKGDRRHPTMRGIAQSLSDQDIADVSAYYEAQSPSRAEVQPHDPPAQVAALIEKGACFSCHGQNFAKPIDASYPKVAGQHADYVLVALKSYKTTDNARVGRSNGIMAPIAQQFSNQELKLLANYIGKLDGDLKTVPQPHFR